MHTHLTSLPTIKGGTAAMMIGLFLAGAAGFAIGGPWWGFLGATCALLGVGWIYHIFHYHQVTREIERFYDQPVPASTPAPVTARAARPQRVPAYNLTALADLDSVQH